MSDINLSKYTILGISGFAGAGKDTIADWFCMKHGFKKLSLATPIKEAVCDILGLTKDQVHGGLKDVELPGGYTPRQALQLLGMEWGRKLDPDIWIKKVLRSIAQQETINFVDGLLGYTPMIWSPPVYKFVHMAKWWIEKEEEE